MFATLGEAVVVSAGYVPLRAPPAVASVEFADCVAPPSAGFAAGVAAPFAAFEHRSLAVW